MKDYKQHTDKYFLRSKHILEKENINPLVRYQVFARKDITSISGINDAVKFIKEHAPDSKIYHLIDGQSCASCEPIMKIEGRVQDLIDLETVYLGYLSGAMTKFISPSIIQHNSYKIALAAKDKPVFYFGARHFDPRIDEEICRICHESGFAGCSTDIGAKHWNSTGIGTIPHALILSIEAWLKENKDPSNPSVTAAQMFNRHMPNDISRILLIDTYNREISDSILAAKTTKLGGVRIDTCGENMSEGQTYVPTMSGKYNKYVYGNGVTISSISALKKKLIECDFEHIKITVSSGFNPEKTAAFMSADEKFNNIYKQPLFDSIGTGSIYPDAIMTTSDIVAYYSENKDKWIEHHKVGRRENPSNRLTNID